MANIKLVGNNWEAEGIFDKTQNKTQKAINSEVISKLNGIEPGAQVNRTYTATTGKPDANQTPSFGGTATISQVTQDTTGQISVTDRTIKIPNSTASTSAAGLMSAADKSALDTAVTNIGTMSDMGTTATTLAGGIGELNDDLNTIAPFDSTPTSGSTKGVTSGGVFTAITKDNLSGKIFNDSNAALSNLNSCVPGANFYNINTTNIPVANTYGTCYDLRSGSWHYQIAISNTGNLFIRNYINSWSAWEPVNLPSEGTVSCEVATLNGHYTPSLKKQGKIVNLSIVTDGTQFNIGKNYTPTVFTIPEGFRPSTTVFMPCVYYLGGSTLNVVIASISSNGNVGFYCPTDNTAIAFVRLCATYVVN